MIDACEALCTRDADTGGPLRSFAEDAQAVLFFLQHGARQVRCYVTSKVLAACFGADDEAGDAEIVSSMLRAFDAHAAAIEQLARRLLGSPDRADSRVIVITTSDVFRLLVQGHLLGSLTARPAGH